jgi:hypothetical protein
MMGKTFGPMTEKLTAACKIFYSERFVNCTIINYWRGVCIVEISL